MLIFILGIIKICFFSLNGNNYLKQLWNYLLYCNTGGTLRYQQHLIRDGELMYLPKTVAVIVRHKKKIKTELTSLHLSDILDVNK